VRRKKVIYLAWAIKKRLSGTVCVPPEYWSLLLGKLIDLGVESLDIEFIGPENISAEHFKPSPAFQGEKGAVSLVHIVRRIMSS
jgi:hypothetical protein